MEIDFDKIDDAVLGLLWLTLHDERRAWKGFDWGALDRLHQNSTDVPGERRQNTGQRADGHMSSRKHRLNNLSK